MGLLRCFKLGRDVDAYLHRRDHRIDQIVVAHALLMLLLPSLLGLTES